MKRLRRLLDLTAVERLNLVQAFAVISLVRLCLWVLPFGTFCQTWVSLLVRAAKPKRRKSLPPQRIVWLTSVASRYVPGAHCLARSFAAHLLLARRGHHTLLQIGVRKDNGSLDAHAWLEFENVPLFESEAHLSQYNLLTSLNPWRDAPGTAR